MRSSAFVLLQATTVALTCKGAITTAFLHASSSGSLSSLSLLLSSSSSSSSRLFADRRNPYRDEYSVPLPRQRIPYDDVNDETSQRTSWESPSGHIRDDFVSEFANSQRDILQQRSSQEGNNLPVVDNQSRRQRRSGSDEYPREYDAEDFDYHDDRENDYRYAEESGNFWANPVANVDTDDYNSPSRRSRRRPVSTTQRSKTSLRSMEPEPPAPLVELYNRLFWYGFGDDDRDAYTSEKRINTQPDKTMFGGTKGKFNGLAFFNAGLDTVPSEKRPRYRTSSSQRPRDDDVDDNRDNSNDDMDEDYYDSRNNYYDNGDDDDDRNRRMAPVASNRDNYRSTERRQTPAAPNRRPPIDADSMPRERQQRSTGRSTRNDQGDWVSNTVSSWFSPTANQDDDWDDGFDEYRAGSTRRGQRSRLGNTNEQGGDTKWSPLALLDTFLGLDRNQLEGQAALYDTQMGLRSTSSNGNDRRSGDRDSVRVAPRQRREPTSSPSSRSWETETPPSRAWPPPVDSSADLRFDPQEEEVVIVVDASDNLPTGIENDTKEEVSDRVIDTEPTPVPNPLWEEPNRRVSHSSTTAGSSVSDAVSWAERALAVERVPPATIPAWGPTGDLGVDARTKAVTDAMEDVQTAQAIVDEWDRHIAADKDEVAIRRIDVELERQQVPRKGEGPAVYNERIRRLDRQVDDMARRLRYNLLQRDLALDELNEIKVRHWALLSFYDPDQAEEGVKDMLRELEESEPAVRRYKEKSTNQSETL